MALEIDHVIHAPRRLEICAYLSVVESAEFVALREALDVSDSVLSKHLKVLVDAAYVRVWKQTALGRAKTWVALTVAGRAAYRDYVTELQKVLKPGQPADE